MINKSLFKRCEGKKFITKNWFKAFLVKNQTGL